MLWKNAKRVALLVEEDVRRVREYALTVITIDKHNRPHVRHHQGKAGLSVIAVVGPGMFQGRTYGEAVLLEVGVSRGRPYSEANRPVETVHRGEHRQIPKRRKWFFLTEEQYRAVAPVLFRIIREMTRARVGKWKRGVPGRPAKIYRSVTRYSHRRHKLETRRELVAVMNGARFSVAYVDRPLMADTLWAENALSQVPRSKILRTARMLGLLTSRYRPSKRTGYKQSRRTFGKGFWKLQFAQTAKKLIARLLPHERIRLTQEIEGNGGNGKKPPVRFFRDRILEAIGRPNRVFSLALNGVLSEPEERVGGTYIRVVAKNGRYMTIEVHPQPIERPQRTEPDWIVDDKTILLHGVVPSVSDIGALPDEVPF